jgi:Mn-containing catalase
VHLVFNLSQGQDERGPWNEGEFKYIENPEPTGGFPPPPQNPDDEHHVSGPAKGRGRRKA